MNKTIQKILLAILSLAIAFSIGYFATPNKVVTKEVIKTNTVKVEGKTRIVYRDRKVLPDGTIIEHEEEREDTNTREETASTSEKSSVTTKDSGLTLSALAISDVKSIGKDQEYGIVASKRVLGAVNVTALVTSDRKVGLGLGWSF